MTIDVDDVGEQRRAFATLDNGHRVGHLGRRGRATLTWYSDQVG
jgi:hypothetical protein